MVDARYKTFNKRLQMCQHGSLISRGYSGTSAYECPALQMFTLRIKILQEICQPGFNLYAKIPLYYKITLLTEMQKNLLPYRYHDNII